MKSKRHKLLSCVVSRDGVLRIEIGVESLAFAAVHGPLADRLDPELDDKRFRVTDAKGFALDVKHELLDEAEDGSNLVHRMLDAAIEQAVNQGSEHFVDTQEMEAASV